LFVVLSISSNCLEVEVGFGLSRFPEPVLPFGSFAPSLLSLASSHFFDSGQRIAEMFCRDDADSATGNKGDDPGAIENAIDQLLKANIRATTYLRHST
jgi:hypothetical protein